MEMMLQMGVDVRARGCWRAREHFVNNRLGGNRLLPKPCPA